MIPGIDCDNTPMVLPPFQNVYTPHFSFSPILYQPFPFPINRIFRQPLITFGSSQSRGLPRQSLESIPNQPTPSSGHALPRSAQQRIRIGRITSWRSIQSGDVCGPGQLHGGSQEWECGSERSANGAIQADDYASATNAGWIEGCGYRTSPAETKDDSGYAGHAGCSSIAGRK